MTTKPLKLQIAERIRNVLADKGIQPEDLTKLTDYNQFSIDRFLSGKSNIPLDFLEKIETVLKMPIIKVEDANGDIQRRAITNTIKKLR